MKTINLTDAVTLVREKTDVEGETQVFSATDIMKDLGVATAPTLASQGTWPGASPQEAGGQEVEDALGRFHVKKVLGEGGMGRVLEALDPELLRAVAVKLILDPNEVDEHMLSRFVAEAQITAQLDHPNIVPVYEMGVTTDGRIFFVMKKVQGRSLREIIDALKAGDPATSQFFNTFRLLMAFVWVCQAVAYAHDHGVLHRDLKPENIMIGDFGQIYVMDWGIARLIGDRTEKLRVEQRGSAAPAKTMDGCAIGTPGYMSPEQARGQVHEMDTRSDVWALGAIIYEILTLERAYDDADPITRMTRTMEGPPADPCTRTPSRDIEEEIAGVCMKAMAQDRDDRIQSALEVAFAIGQYLEGVKQRDPEAAVDCETSGM
jgi:serine/threonine-protein kinase